MPTASSISATTIVKKNSVKSKKQTDELKNDSTTDVFDDVYQSLDNPGFKSSHSSNDKIKNGLIDNNVNEPKEIIEEGLVNETKAEKISKETDDFIFDASIRTLPIDYDKMIQIVLIGSDLFLLGVILFLVL